MAVAGSPWLMNQVFFPQDVLDILVAIGRVDVEGDELVLTPEGFRYAVQEAVRVVEEVTTGDDPRGLCGKVTVTSHLIEDFAAEILGASMIIEDSAYDVVPGLLAAPAGEPPSTAGDEAAALRELGEVDEIREAFS
ncbi:MAG: hypothetical protein AAF928_10565 [Myxococcota bacterium]